MMSGKRKKKEGWKEGGWICYNDVQTHRNIHFERYSTAAKMLEKRTGRLFTWKLGRMPCLVVLIFGLNHTAEEEMFLSSLGMGKQKYLFECLYVCVEDRRASPGFCGRLCIFALSLKAGFWFNWEAWAGESHLTGRKIGAKPRWLWMDTLVCVCVLEREGESSQAVFGEITVWWGISPTCQWGATVPEWV